MNKNVLRGGAAIAASGAAVAALVAVSAPASAVGGATVTKHLANGTGVKIELSRQRAVYAPSVVALPTSRNVWLSGKVKVTVLGDATGGSIETGYLIGCQLSLQGSAGAEGSYDAAAGAAPGADGAAANPAAGAGGGASGSLTISPGEIGYVPIISYTDSDDNTVNAVSFEGKTGGFAFSQETLKLDGCVGYAAAKLVVKVSVSGDGFSGIVNAWGKPFTIG